MKEYLIHFLNDLKQWNFKQWNFDVRYEINFRERIFEYKVMVSFFHLLSILEEYSEL